MHGVRANHPLRIQRLRLVPRVVHADDDWTLTDAVSGGSSHPVGNFGVRLLEHQIRNRCSLGFEISDLRFLIPDFEIQCRRIVKSGIRNLKSEIRNLKSEGDRNSV